MGFGECGFPCILGVSHSLFIVHSPSLLQFRMESKQSPFYCFLESIVHYSLLRNGLIYAICDRL